MIIEMSEILLFVITNKMFIDTVGWMQVLYSSCLKDKDLIILLFILLPKYSLELESYSKHLSASSTSAHI